MGFVVFNLGGGSDFGVWVIMGGVSPSKLVCQISIYVCAISLITLAKKDNIDRVKSCCISWNATKSKLKWI